DLDPELVSHGFEHELTGDGGGGLATKARHEVFGGVAGKLDVRVERAAATANDGIELAQQRARARFDERTRNLNLRRFGQPIERRAAERLVDLGLDLRPDAFLDVGAQL